MTMHSEQKRIFMTMTSEKRLELAFRLYYSARELKVAALKDSNPQLSEKELNIKVKEAFLYGRD
jgi:hypothetical protein